MTIVVCVRVTDGIVLASDSASSMVESSSGEVVKVYNHADKIFNLVKGLPIGAMTYGAGSIGAASLSTISKDLRHKLSGTIGNQGPPTATAYTVESVATTARDFLAARYQAAFPNGVPNFYLGYRVCGYSTGGALPEAWEVGIQGSNPFGPKPLYEHTTHTDVGPRWAGEGEALDRLILGVGTRFCEVLEANGIDRQSAESVCSVVVGGLKAPLCLPSMPIQDAIELTRFLAEVSSGFTRFSIRPPTVGGPIEVAVITKHEGFRWISRKHFYSQSLNVT